MYSPNEAARIADYEIDEIRRIRRRISAQCGRDLQKVAEYYRTIEKELRASGRYKFCDELSGDVRTGSAEDTS